VRKNDLRDEDLNDKRKVTFFLFIPTYSDRSVKELALHALYLAAPLTSILALWSIKSENWIFLYFKRKALEEKKKIDSISG
jgi:hypothetical protein